MYFRSPISFFLLSLCLLYGTDTEKTAESVEPGDIQIQPSYKIVFNAPFDNKHVYDLRIINISERRIWVAVKTTNSKRFVVDPETYALNPNEDVFLNVSCEPFAYVQENTNNDAILFEWTNAPAGAANHSRSEWGSELIRSKNLPIEYNS